MSEKNIQRSFMMDENDFEFIQGALYRFAKKRRADAELTKNGYGSASSAAKRAAYLLEAEQAEELVSRMAEIFI